MVKRLATSSLDPLGITDMPARTSRSWYRKFTTVYMGNLGEDEKSSPTYHTNMLQEVVDTWRMNPKAEFSYGTGPIYPVKAIDPGLVYETSPDDYLKFLCNSGRNESMPSKLFGRSIHFPDLKTTSTYLNYPTMTLRVTTNSHATDQERKIYIVYMGHLGENEEEASPTFHSNMLQDVVESRFQSQSLIRSYGRTFNGFVASLTHEEKEKLASRKEVLSIFPSITLRPQTTRSWDFMGLGKNAKRNPTVESDTIMGKLIGARYYNSAAPSETDSARDIVGHGSHTASIAAGNAVSGASFYGIANGIARGGVPSARIAAYKVCLPSGCQSADILAAFDDAIADGVDIITISIGNPKPILLEVDVIAIGSFFASNKGILVVQSAGNSGPGLVSSTVPWLFTVAAGTTDRGIISTVVLGNGATMMGKAVNPFDLKEKRLPLAYGKEATSTCTEQEAMECAEKCIEKGRVNGQVVICNRYQGMGEAFNAGALGSVVPSTKAPDVAFVVPFPASGLSIPFFTELEGYFNSTKDHTVEILKSEMVHNDHAPSVASFSSRGPNVLFQRILKPDVTAPGVEILAAFSPLSSPSEFPQDKRSVKYNILSGTSMSCPHVAGAAAYVKSFHPKWSPSAIKSALMTTAWRMNATKDPKAEFSYGTGHIDPVKAADPGLVYEISTEDYIVFLCNSGYDSGTLQIIFGAGVIGPAGCPENRTSNDLNYPAMAYTLKSNLGKKSAIFSAKFNRTVTNVGPISSIYKATTSSSLRYNITVEPSILKFTTLGERRSFVVTISGKTNPKKPLISASMEWSDGVRSVRSPIVVYSYDIIKDQSLSNHY
ncbi:Subtilisin serine endopeptidase family protein [Dorcoceras hygrometricum]|uniref:Subtilisin serine endopeptidase family protein n=1 Tax=Dorcoceras hygrometricum TaxID=472368 RepID=A0A2Z7CJL7_9LAMI|nr:Subtilisin serine endopeptidase family protein [Dorcoceras hygrometricum]